MALLRENSGLTGQYTPYHHLWLYFWMWGMLRLASTAVRATLNLSLCGGNQPLFLKNYRINVLHGAPRFGSIALQCRSQDFWCLKEWTVWRFKGVWFPLLFWELLMTSFIWNITNRASDNGGSWSSSKWKSFSSGTWGGGCFRGANEGEAMFWCRLGDNPPPSNSGNEGLGWDSLLKM